MESTTTHTINQTLPKGYKKSAIGLIPIDWEVKKLGELSDIKTGKKDNQDKEDNGIYPFYVRSKNIERINSYSYDGEAILVPGEGNIGEIFHYINGKFDYHQRVYKISDFNKETLGKFIYYYFQIFFLKETIRHSVKATVDSLRLPTFTEMVIHLPSLPEQQKIADILSTWDEAIALTKKTIDTLKERNKGLAQQLLTGKKRLNGFSEKWETKKIIEISNEISQKNKADEDLIVLSCTKYDGLVPSLEYFGRKIYSDNLTTYKIVEKNTFAYATNHIEEGSIGYQNKYDSALISPMYTVFKTLPSINDAFLFRVLKSNHYIQEYQRRMEGSIDRRGGLRWQEFSKIKINLPSVKEQTEIAQVLETADQELKNYEAKLEQLQLQKKGLMQQLLTGKIRVS